MLLIFQASQTPLEHAQSMQTCPDELAALQAGSDGDVISGALSGDL
jgi:hypothetical protein